MTPSRQNSVVLVTGASGAIGKVVAREFLRQGWLVVAGYLTGDIKEEKNLFPVKLDVMDRLIVKNVFNKIMENFGRLDCLINTAGIVCDSLLINMGEKEWDNVLNVNLKGTMNCCREAAEIMSKNGGGHIINFASISAKTGRTGQTNYAASKAAVIGFSLSLAKEVGNINIKVNVVIPGFIESKMTARLKKEIKRMIISENALGRTTTAEEIARFCHFLATTENISGQVFQLDSRIMRWI